ncbi:MAG TPA: DUF4870 domain-containing protein [Candidatus Sulfotelmatobacter sp.]|nr:DUF4870 domain-containing protein [Candidatus Sulfotelmatobacter sp.]
MHGELSHCRTAPCSKAIKICTKHIILFTIVSVVSPNWSAAILSRAPRSDMLPAMEQIAVGLKSCPVCAAQMPDSAAFCPGCGRSMQSELAAKQKPASLRENFLGAFAYVSFIPALVFLLVNPYRKNSFVRFHSIQCLLFWLACVVFAVVVRVALLGLLFIPIVGPLLAVLVAVVVALAALFTWIVLLVKAFQGERFTLPVIGNLSEQYSDVT